MTKTDTETRHTNRQGKIQEKIRKKQIQRIYIYMYSCSNRQLVSWFPKLYFMKPFIRSIGRGKMMVEFFSAEMELRVCR